MESQTAARSTEPSIDVDVSAASTDHSLGVVPGLVWAFQIHENGTIESLPTDKPIEKSRDGWLWLHFSLADARAISWLRASDFPAPAVALLLSRDRHQQLHATESCVYGIFADLVRSLDRPIDEIAHLRFIMTEHMLVSGRYHPLSSVETTREALERGLHRVPHVAALLELIVDHVADAIDRLADELTKELDQIETDLIARKRRDERQKLGRLRLVSVQLHRQLSGLRTLFHRLEREGTDGLKPPLRIAAGKLAQRLDSLDHDIVEMRDCARLMQEEVSASLAEEANDHLQVLSILTIFFLPPTFVTGVFGMNTKGLPLTDVETGFLWAVVLMISSIAAVYLILRRVGVFKARMTRD
jgi:zinc transporter